VVAAAHHQRSFRAEQTGFFFLLRSCELAGLRSRGISRFIKLSTAAVPDSVRTAYRHPLPPRISQQCQINPMSRTSIVQPQSFQHIAHSSPLFANATLYFQRFAHPFAKNTRIASSMGLAHRSISIAFARATQPPVRMNATDAALTAAAAFVLSSVFRMTRMIEIVWGT
jgi:hypothetical protein